MMNKKRISSCFPFPATMLSFEIMTTFSTCFFAKKGFTLTNTSETRQNGVQNRHKKIANQLFAS
jgi:hypothetical protein